MSSFRQKAGNYFIIRYFLDHTFFCTKTKHDINSKTDVDTYIIHERIQLEKYNT